MSSALRLTQTELVDLQARTAGARTPAQMRDAPAEKARRSQKYGNTKVVDGGITFDSKAEHKRWQYLVLLQKAREISDLQLQVPFVLIPAQVAPSGKKERATVYIADFAYVTSAGIRIVEDVKGAVTPEFRLKRKLMLHVHGIEVREIRS